MKMTTDELIKEMEEEYDAFLKGTGLDDPLHMERERKNNLDCEQVCTANEMTLDILRKYQKIERIVKEWSNSGLIQNQLYDLIKEVIEDGKIDCN